MPNIFEKQDNAKLLSRLNGLTSNTRGLWGKMTVAQMVLHCQKPMDVAEGKLKIKLGLAAILFGRMAKSSFLRSDGFEKNLPTSSEFKIQIEPDFEIEKQKLAEAIKRFGENGTKVIVDNKHPFFGAMNEEEWGILQYLHLDHHFRQFGI